MRGIMAMHQQGLLGAVLDCVLCAECQTSSASAVGASQKPAAIRSGGAGSQGASNVC